jgi:hypothetical protein
VDDRPLGIGDRVQFCKAYLDDLLWKDRHYGWLRGPGYWTAMRGTVLEPTEHTGKGRLRVLWDDDKGGFGRDYVSTEQAGSLRRER